MKSIEKKVIHFRLLPDTHAKLRIFCFEKKMSVQKFLEDLLEKELKK